MNVGNRSASGWIFSSGSKSEKKWKLLIDREMKELGLIEEGKNQFLNIVGIANVENVTYRCHG